VIRSITVPGAGIELSAVEAELTDTDRIPIFLIHENRGLVPYMIGEITRLTERGHRVVAPDLLTRIGGTAAFADDPTSVSTRAIDGDTHVADLIAAYDWMASSEPKMAVVGFCFGAEMGWRLLEHRTPEFAVLWYGICPEPVAVARTRTRVLATYAQDDPRVNDTLGALCDALAWGDADVTLESYPGTRHAFADHTRPERHDPAAAAEMWRRTNEFLDRA
jgi:carboxymethylenebutenolidase